MDPIVRTVIIFGLSLLFTSAASHKLLNRSLFTEQLSAYGLVPPSFLGLGILVIPLVELSLATALLIPFMRTLALQGSAVLLTLYAMVMLVTIMRGRANIDCGCSGAEGTSSVSYGHIIRNLVLSLAALLASSPAIARAMSLNDWVLCVLITLTFTAFYQAANQLMANRPLLKHYREV